MARLLFEKTGKAIWISHLDLMRLFQRAFKRAGLPLKHTQGFNPRPSVSIALPLSVGVESRCELLDFDLDGCDVPLDEITRKLNTALVDGVRVYETYASGCKLRDLSFLSCTVKLCYQAEATEEMLQKVKDLFSRDSLPVMKKSKNGFVEQDIIPLIRSIQITSQGNAIVLDAIIPCQNPSMNPMQLSQAIQTYLPDCATDLVTCCRNEIYDSNQNVFR